MEGPNIVVAEIKQVPLCEQGFEICERKGLGHPDQICDAVMNAASVALCAEYQKRFKTILHHNVDKALLAAGKTEVRFGGGVVDKPMRFVFGGRATFQAGGQEIPVKDIVTSTAKRWFRDNLRFVNPDEHVQYQVEIDQSAASLRDIFDRSEIGANDTSAAVGFAPMTSTEQIVLESEQFLNSEDFKTQFPVSGEDIKVMGLRQDRELDLTVAIAFVDRYVMNEQDYFRYKEEIKQVFQAFVKDKVEMNVRLGLNLLDERGRGLDGIYLTVLGTSAEAGDCGQVGRGNRANGIISLNRPATAEAAAGKNPISHVGKIYNVLSYQIADKIYRNVPGIREVYVWLLSEIGRPISQPKITSAQIIPEPGIRLDDISNGVREVIESALEQYNIRKFCDKLARGEIPVC